jgi:hypothetical protein
MGDPQALTDLGLGVGGGRPGPVAEDLVGPGEQLLFLAVDQGGVDPVLAGQFVDSLVPLESAAKATWALNAAECCFRLPAIASPFLGHLSSLLSGPVFGVHYTVYEALKVISKKIVCLDHCIKQNSGKNVVQKNSDWVGLERRGGALQQSHPLAENDEACLEMWRAIPRRTKGNRSGLPGKVAARTGAMALETACVRK